MLSSSFIILKSILLSLFLYRIFLVLLYVSLFEYHYSLTNSKLIFDYTVFEKASELLVQDEDSVSLPRLFWFYYSYYNLVLRGNLKWFIAQIVNKNFDKFAYHWSFTIRQVYFKFLIYVINDKLKDKEGRLFNQQKLNPFRSRNSINYQQKPYSFEAMKDFDTNTIAGAIEYILAYVTDKPVIENES